MEIKKDISNGGEINVELEKQRIDKVIGSSLEAKVIVNTPLKVTIEELSTSFSF